MGGKSTSSSTTNQTQHTDPYGPASGSINSLVARLGSLDPSITSTETGALDAISANAAAGNPYAPKIGEAATTMLGGGNTALQGAFGGLESLIPMARGDLVNPESNPQLQSYLSTIGNDVTNRVKSVYAGSGRDPAGAGSFGGNLARGISAGTAPVLYDAYNQERGRQMGAIDALYKGGMTSLLSGVDTSKAAMNAQDSPFMQQLAVEAQRRGIPLQNITSLLSPLSQVGQMFGTTSGTSNTKGEQQMSGAQQFLAIAQGLGSLFGGGKTGQPVSMGY